MRTLPAVPAPSRPRGGARRRASLRRVRPRQPLFKQVDHVVVGSADAERLFLLFRDDLGLPQAWPYQSHGSVTSGAVTLGNVALEFVATEGAGTDAAFTGIAFEPVGDAADAVAELDRRHVAHGEEDRGPAGPSSP